MEQRFFKVLATLAFVSLCMVNANASVNVFDVGRYGAHADARSNDSPVKNSVHSFFVSMQLVNIKFKKSHNDIYIFVGSFLIF
jgi:hypothetical protein